MINDMVKKNFNEQEIENEKVNDVETSCGEGCGQENGGDCADNVAEDVAFFAKQEGLTAHARSAVIRMEEL